MAEIERQEQVQHTDSGGGGFGPGLMVGLAIVVVVILLFMFLGGRNSGDPVTPDGGRDTVVPEDIDVNVEGIPGPVE